MRGAFELQWKEVRRSTDVADRVELHRSDHPPARGFALANARVSYDLPWTSGPSQTPTRLVLYVKNIFDERPRETLIGVDSRLAGREVFGGLTFGF